MLEQAEKLFNSGNHMAARLAYLNAQTVLLRGNRIK